MGFWSLEAPKSTWIICFDEWKGYRSDLISRADTDAPQQGAQILKKQMAEQQSLKDAAVAPNFDLKFIRRWRC